MGVRIAAIRRRACRTASAPSGDPPWVRRLLIGLTLAIVFAFLVAPLWVIFAEAFRMGWRAYAASLQDPAAAAAIRLTLATAAVAVPLNVAFGLAAAWSVSRFAFRGKSLLVSLIDLPFSVSPVVAGLVFTLIFGLQGWLGPWLEARGVQILFAFPSIALATLFVTCPFVARELIPTLQEQGGEEELAAYTLGARGWQVFWRITLPNIRWALFYGVMLCNARAMGEFGAVSVVSGHIHGRTLTIPLAVEALYNEHRLTAAFAVASLLTLPALLTLALKSWMEWAGAGEKAAPSRRLRPRPSGPLADTSLEEASR